MIYAIIGRREQGKTTLACTMARKLDIRVIVDPRGMIDPVRGSHRVTRIEHLDVAFDCITDGVESEIVITPDVKLKDMFAETCEQLRTIVKTAPSMRLAILFDECRFFDLEACEAFDWLLRCVPRRSMHILLTCHRPVDLPPNVRAIVDQWMMFRCTQEHDLALIAKLCKIDVATKVAMLPDHHFIQWDDGKSIAYVHDDPSVWYLAMSCDREGYESAPDRDMPRSTLTEKRRLF